MLVYWGKRGGGSAVTLRLAQRLAEELGAANVAISLSARNEDLDDFARLKLQILEMNIPTASDLILKFPAVIQKLNRQASQIKAFAPDLVVFTMNFPLAWPFIHFLQKRNIRVAFTAHDARPHPGDYAVVWQTVTQKLILKSADSVITHSDFVRRELSEQLRDRETPVRVVPLEGFYAKEQHIGSRPHGAGPVRLLFFGRLIRYKGLQALAHALEPLRTRSDWMLTLAGHGPDADEVRSAFGTWPQVDLRIGWHSWADLESMLRDHDALLCPYVEASQSGVIAEAITFGLPSLVMPNGALAEQIGFGEAGLVAPDASSEGFRAIITEILDNPHQLTRLSEGALRLLDARRPPSLWRAIAGTDAPVATP